MGRLTYPEGVKHALLSYKESGSTSETNGPMLWGVKHGLLSYKESGAGFRAGGNSWNSLIFGALIGWRNIGSATFMEALWPPFGPEC